MMVVLPMPFFFNVINFLFLLVFPVISECKRFFIAN